MAVLAFTNGKVLVNSVDLSDHGTQVSLEMSADAPETTAFNAAGNKSFTGGLKSWSGSITMRQDFANSSIDATLAALIGTTVPISLNPVNGANSTSNPNYSGQAVITGYQPVSGQVGDVLNTQLTFQGTGALARATS